MVAPFLQISGLEQSIDQPQEAVVSNVLGEEGTQHCVIQPIETLGDVSLDEPCCPSPRFGYFRQSSVTALARPEAVGVLGELRLVIRFQQGTDHFLQQLVRPRGQTQRATLSR
jgi:hypothetical protein